MQLNFLEFILILQNPNCIMNTVENLINFNRLQYTSFKLKLIDLYNIKH